MVHLQEERNAPQSRFISVTRTIKRFIMRDWASTVRSLLIISLVLLPGILTFNNVIVYASNHTAISILLSPSSVGVGDAFTAFATLSGATSTATGTVAYQVFAGASCSGVTSQVMSAAVTAGVVPSVSFKMTSTGTFGVNAIYSGDPNNLGSTSLCKQVVVTKGTGAATTLATKLLSPLSISAGGSVIDTAILSGTNVGSAGGAVQYTLYFGGSCSGTIQQANQVSVTAGSVPTSNPFTIFTPGTYSLRASYSGDPSNLASTSPCETGVSVQGPVFISTALSATTINVGQHVTDVATLAGFAHGAAGSITFTIYSDFSCTGTVLHTFTTPVTDGVENSAYVTPNFIAGGPYSFLAVYSGDSLDAKATSDCELLTVMANPTVTTKLSSPSISEASFVFDTATLISATANAGGTVTYQLFPPGSVLPGYATGCGGLPLDTDQESVSSGIVTKSKDFYGFVDSYFVDFVSPGTYFFNAVYSGDAFNHGATSGCELLTVTKAQPSITTLLSASTIDFGGSVTDSATLTGVTATAGGTVTYNLYTNGGCSGSTVSKSDTETVTNGMVPPPLPSFLTPIASGSYSIRAVYSGDSDNNVATSSCESFTVVPPVTVTVSYLVTGGSGSSTAPWFNYVYEGVAQHVQLTTTGVPESVDSGSTWTVSQTSGGSASTLLLGSSGTEQWVLTSPSDSGSASAGTIVFSYQHQYFLTMTAGTGGTVAPPSGFQNAGAGVIITATPNSGYSFTGWTGSGTGSYTGMVNPQTITMNGPITETASFSNVEVTMTVSYSVIGGSGSSTAPWFNYFSGGVAQHVLLTTSGVPESVDSGSTWTLSQTLGGSASLLLGGSSSTEQWVTTADTGTASAGTTVFTYQHQYSLTMIVSPAGEGTTTPTGSVSPGTSTWENAAATPTITATPNSGFTFSGWVGSGIGSYTGNINPQTITMDGPITETAFFTYLEVTMTVSYSITCVICTSGSSASWFNYFSGGVAQHVQLTMTPTAYSVDSGSTWTVSQTSGGSASNLLLGSSSTEQWITSQSVSGTASAETIVFTYQNQYSLTMIISPAGEGTTTPTGSVSPGTSTWENDHASVIITATAISPHIFSGWVGTGLGSYTGNINPQTITMNAPITETAFFT
jgi:uncharacterized repeat protein (TIGR02543 family)